MSNVKKTYVKCSAPSKPSLICCRACLTMDGKLYNMHEYKLVDAFIRVSGITMRHDKLPHHLCSYCAALLRRCTDFQAKCGRAQLCLLSGLMQKDLSLEYVRSIDRVTNKLLNDLTTSELTTTIIEDQDIKDTTPERNKLNNIDTNNDNESNNVDTNNDNDTSTIDTSIDKITTNNIDTNNDKNTTNNKNTINDKNTPYPYIKSMYGLNVEVKECKTELDLDDDNLNGDVVDIDNHIVDIGGFIVRDIEEIVKKKKIEPVIKVANRPKRKNYNRKKKEKVQKEKAAKKEPKKPIIREERISRVDFAKFERTYNMKIITLTKEEQLKEIETRKQSARYKDAAFHCEECGKGFQVEAAFKNHCKKHDPSAGDYSCPICTVRFKRHNILLGHKDTHRTQIVCQQCGFISQTRSQALVHYRMHAGKKYCCQYCGKTCTTKSHYLTHVRVYHPTEHVSCELCGEMFLGLKGVRLHKSITHSVYLTQEYKCLVCSKIFISSEALKTHTESAGDGDADGHQELSPCDMCGHNLMSEELLQQHMMEQHPKCDLCHQTFLTAAAQRTHHKRKHLGERYDPFKAGAVRPQPKRRQTYKPNKYMCEYCGKMQPCQAVLLEHKRKHEDVRPFACPECPKRFCTKTQLKGHMRTHTGERPFQCGHCSLRFGAKKNMERHILNGHMRTHTGERPFQCGHCSLRFGAKKNMERHILNKHLAQKFPCEICGRFFTTRDSVKLHVRTVHGGEPWPRRDRRPKARRALQNSAEDIDTTQ